LLFTVEKKERTLGSPLRVVLRAANQNPMIAGGNHTIIHAVKNL